MAPATEEFNFHDLSIKAVGDERLKTAVSANTLRQYQGRQQRMVDLPDPDGLRLPRRPH